jgi:predicted translin family RNA/ssDNA-binding protein
MDDMEKIKPSSLDPVPEAQVGMQWVSMLEYASRFQISLSTLRRRIKANQIRFLLRDGRYLIEAPLQPKQTDMEQELRKAREEIADLKSLLATYESLLYHS